jgi:hypothetical protein
VRWPTPGQAAFLSTELYERVQRASRTRKKGQFLRELLASTAKEHKEA